MDSFSIYMQKIRNLPMMTPDQERVIAELSKKGDLTAERKMIESNLRFVIVVAKKYQNQGLPLEDLVNAGNIGLIKAARRFDPSKNFRFISYAVWWIRQSILKELAETSRIVRVPVNQAVNLSIIRKRLDEIFKKVGNNNPSIRDIAEHLNFDENHTRTLFMTDNPVLYLDDSNSEDSSSYIENFSDQKGSEFDQVDINNMIEHILLSLSPRERKIIQEYYGLNEGEVSRTLEEIGSRVGLTRERVRQIKEEAIQKIRKTMTEEVY